MITSFFAFSGKSSASRDTLNTKSTWNLGRKAGVKGLLVGHILSHRPYRTDACLLVPSLPNVWVLDFDRSPASDSAVQVPKVSRSPPSFLATSH